MLRGQCLIVLFTIALIACQHETAGQPSTASALAAEPTLAGLDPFIEGLYIHGIPWETAHRFPKEAVPRLVAMLGDPRRESQWSNIASTLCMMGDARATAPLIAFFRASRGRLSRERFVAIQAILMHMGLIVHRSDDAAALNFLLSISNKAANNALDLPWTGPYPVDSGDELNRMLLSNALWGLSTTGKDAALEAYKRIGQREDLADSTRNVLSEATAAFTAIRERGLVAYYESMKRY